MMKHAQYGILVASIVVATHLPTDAATMVVRNGVTWAYTFEGDVADLTTSSPAWSTFDKNGFATESSDGDIYSYLSGSTGVTNSYSAPNWSGTGNQRTAEIRVRVPDASLQAADGSAAFTAGNGNAYDIRIYQDRIAYNGTGGVTDPSNIVSLDLSEFRILRAVVDPTASPAYKLYVDNNPIPVLERNDFWFGGFDVLLFGDLSTGGISGQVEVDYISWTPGAFVPIPEPSTAMLLGLMGVALIGLKRHRRSVAIPGV